MVMVSNLIPSETLCVTAGYICVNLLAIGIWLTALMMPFGPCSTWVRDHRPEDKKAQQKAAERTLSAGLPRDAITCSWAHVFHHSLTAPFGWKVTLPMSQVPTSPVLHFDQFLLLKQTFFLKASAHLHPWRSIEGREWNYFSGADDETEANREQALVLYFHLGSVDIWWGHDSPQAAGYSFCSHLLWCVLLLCSS